MKKRLSALFLLLLLPFLGCATAHPDTTARPAPTRPEPQITYGVATPDPHTHYVTVTMHIGQGNDRTNAKKNGYVDLKMPVWTPGSYLIREYAKNVEGFTASADTGPLRSEKIRKNAWRVYTNSDNDLTVQYRVYANELSVRTSYVDDTHAYLMGASVFLYHDALKNLPLTVQITPATGWKKIATALIASPSAPNTYLAPNYDLLVDSPIEIGNHTTLNFTASGIPHTIAMYSNGPLEYNAARLTADYQRVCETAAQVVGEHPCQQYLFIVHHTAQGGGGLEHLNSTTLQTNRSAYATEASYKGFLTLVAHEYFHLWNVKRIRPVALGPFDYETENYTRLLWLSEGCTSFYEDYILRRAGFHSPDDYLKIVANDITGVENQPGNRVQSVAESSFDAWIKYYRPNENSANSTVSYYSKGAVLGTLLNLAILAGSQGQRSLDDLMRLLYTEYYKKQQRGFTDAEFRRAAEQVAGTPLTDFFDTGVNGTGPLNYAAFFEPVGMRLTNTAPAQADGFLGASAGVNPANGRQTITAIRRGAAAETGGLAVGDEVLAVDSVRLTDDLTRTLANRKPGDRVRLIVNRGGQLRELPITLVPNPLLAYRLEPIPNPTDAQKTLYTRWLYIK